MIWLYETYGFEYIGYFHVMNKVLESNGIDKLILEFEVPYIRKKCKEWFDPDEGDMDGKYKPGICKKCINKTKKDV